VGAAGKFFPQNARADHIPGAGSGKFTRPPRRWWMEMGETPQGALMAKWVGLSFQSGDYSQVDAHLEWRFPHPTITAADPYWLLQWQLEWNGLNDANAGYRVRIRWSYHEDGTEWGYWPWEPQYWSSLAAEGNRQFMHWSLWNFINATQFKNGGFDSSQWVRVTTWAEMPDFHPYRTRP